MGVFTTEVQHQGSSKSSGVGLCLLGQKTFAYNASQLEMRFVCSATAILPSASVQNRTPYIPEKDVRWLLPLHIVLAHISANKLNPRVQKESFHLRCLPYPRVGWIFKVTSFPSFEATTNAAYGSKKHVVSLLHFNLIRFFQTRESKNETMGSQRFWKSGPGRCSSRT